MIRRILLGFVLFCTEILQAEPVLVLFNHEQGITVSSNRPFDRVVDELKKETREGKNLLSEWLSSRVVAAQLDELWIVNGVATHMSKEAAEQLRREKWVAAVVDNSFKQFIDLPQQSSRQDVQNEERPWGLTRIGLEKLQEIKPDIRGQGVRVAILDTGIQSKHPEFADLGAPVVFRDFVSGLPFPYDDHGHGTHVAGTIGGAAVGIAPQVELVVAKVFTAGGGATDGTILAAMQWVLDPDGDPNTKDRPSVANNSWGLSITDGIHEIEKYLHFRRAVQVWVAGGIIPVFSAGNSGSKPNGVPAGFPEVVSVGAFDSEDKAAEFTSLGPNVWKNKTTVFSLFKPEISAPGVGVRSSLPGNIYDAWSGTSMAAPHITGAIALYQQAHPDASMSDIVAKLITSSETRLDLAYGHGLINLVEFVLEKEKK